MAMPRPQAPCASAARANSPSRAPGGMPSQRCSPRRQHPRHRLAGATEHAQRVVLHQRLGLARRAAPREVGGRGVQAAAERGHPARGERRVVAQVAHADRDVEVLADQVDEARRQVDLQRDRRIARARTRASSGASTRFARSPGIVTRSRPLGSPGGVCASDAAASTSSTTWCACSSTARPKSVTVSLRVVRSSRRSPSCALERGDAPRDGRLRQAQALGGAREAAFVDHAGEQQQVVRLRGSWGVHVRSRGASDCPVWWNNDIHFEGFWSCWEQQIYSDHRPTQRPRSDP